MQVLWDVTLLCCVSTCCCLKGLYCLHLQSQAAQED